ncbi:MAG: hypothetical protein O9289_06065 [Rhodobacteraceae bacterium]|nr:hypothetical protein [Paracoccaceae bacterium]MCZ8082752.1 hypothetical protein [Paracoccaceae bacterium]
MAAAPRKRVNVQYRKLDDITGGFGGTSLQDALTKCMQTMKAGQAIGANPVVRVLQLPDYGNLVLNLYHAPSSHFFGEIVRYEPGADLPLLQVSSGVSAYNLTQAKAPPGHEPLRGVLYFLAVKNHVALVEADLSPARAETYLTWLLKNQAGVVANDTHVVLLAELKSATGQLQLKEVEEVVFRPNPIVSTKQTAAPLQGGDGALQVASTSKDVAATNTWEVLKAAGMDDTDLTRLAEDNTKIEVTLQIRFMGGKRKKHPISIADTNRLLRNIPEDELVLKGPTGRQKSGSIEKLTYPANVALKGSLLDPKDMARALLEGYNSFVANGYIDP